jgi:carbamoyltransferase
VQDVCSNFNFARYRPIYASEQLARAYWQECLSPAAAFGMLRDRFSVGDATRFHPTDHHDAHLHAALASCPFERSLAVVMDAAGEIGATSVYLCDGPTIARLARYPITQSLGIFYSLVTQFLGYAFNEDE